MMSAMELETKSPAQNDRCSVVHHQSAVCAKDASAGMMLGAREMLDGRLVVEIGSTKYGLGGVSELAKAALKQASW